MIVMDDYGEVPIAKAKKINVGWLLTAVNGSWTDPRARDNGGRNLPIYPQYLLVKKKNEARSILKSLLEVGRHA